MLYPLSYWGRPELGVQYPKTGGPNKSPPALTAVLDPD